MERELETHPAHGWALTHLLQRQRARDARRGRTSRVGEKYDPRDGVTGEYSVSRPVAAATRLQLHEADETPSVPTVFTNTSPPPDSS